MSGAQLRITDGKGFHIITQHGITLSVQIGPGNYSDNYDLPFGQQREYGYRLPPSAKAEIAVWSTPGELLHLASGDNVAGWVRVENIFAAIPALMAATTDDEAVAVVNSMLEPTP